jgi:ligand-binding SRPBCC domain-containing protein
MTDSTFECEQWVPSNIKDVFIFFAEAKNLESITPPHLNFKIIEMSTENITKGTLIDYKIRLYGAPMEWKTHIREFKENEMFIDEQLKGPYTKWLHTHTFQEKDGGTLIIDHILYKIPFGSLGNLILGNFIRKDIQAIFNYRKNFIKEYFSHA